MVLLRIGRPDNPPVMLVRYSIVLFIMPYAVCPEIESGLETYGMLVIATEPDLKKQGRATCVRKQGIRTVTTLCRSNASNDTCSVGWVLLLPELLIRMSIPLQISFPLPVPSPVVSPTRFALYQVKQPDR